jgi:PKD repeat protein
MIVAPAMNVSVLPGGTVMFSGSGTGDQITYRWRFPGGTPSSSTRQNPGSVRFNNVGTFIVSLTVIDRRGRTSAPATRVITVASPNQSPRVGEDCLNVDETDDRDEEHRRDREHNRDD